MLNWGGGDGRDGGRWAGAIVAEESAGIHPGTSCQYVLYYSIELIVDFSFI